MDEYKYTLTNLLTSKVKVLTEPPKEWSKMTRLWQRSNTYNSIFRELTSAIIFPRVGNEQEDKAGYYFIINALDIYGTKSEMSFKREKRDPLTNKYVYDGIWMMDFDPEGGVPRTIDDVSVEMTDSSKLAKVMARDEIDVSVFSTNSLDDIEITPFSFIYQEATYTPIDILLECTFTGIFDATLNASSVSFASQEAYMFGATDVNEIGDRINLSSAPPGNKKFYDNTLDTSSRFNLTELSGISNHIIKIRLALQTDSWTYKAYIVAELHNGSFVYETNEVQIIDLSGDGDFDTRTDISYDTFPVVVDEMLPGYYYNLFVRVDWDHNSDPTSSSIESSIETSVLSSDSYETTEGEPENEIRGLLSYEYFTRLLQLYTSELDTSKLLRSNFLGRTDSQFQTYPSNGLGSGLFNTNGFQLRQLTSKALNGSLKDAFKSYDAMNALGMGYDVVNDVFFIEPIEEFYKDEAFPFTIEDVRDLEITFSKEHYWNNLLGGYPKVEYEDFQGVNEYNTQIEYSSFVQSKTKVDKRSLYFGDSIGAELARRLNETRFASQDTKYDNNNYIHDTENLVTKTNGINYSGFEGIEQYYNENFSPRQNAVKHTGLLSSIFWADRGDKMNFRKALKDTNITANGVEEFSDIYALQWLTNFIIPDVYKFEGTVTQEIIDQIKADPHRYITFTDTYDKLYYGYILSVEANDYEGKAVYTLIRANINR